MYYLYKYIGVSTHVHASLPICIYIYIDIYNTEHILHFGVPALSSSQKHSQPLQGLNIKHELDKAQAPLEGPAETLAELTASSGDPARAGT